MPLVCPFWANYVKAVELCQDAVGATAYFLERNWDGVEIIVPNLTHESLLVGSGFTGPDEPILTPYSGTPTEVYAGTWSGLGFPFAISVAVLAKMNDGVDASTVSWTMNQVSGSTSISLDLVDTYLDNALLCFSYDIPGSLGPHNNVLDFTPTSGGVAGPAIRLNFRVFVNDLS